MTYIEQPHQQKIKDAHSLDMESLFHRRQIHEEPKYDQQDDEQLEEHYEVPQGHRYKHEQEETEDSFLPHGTKLAPEH